MSAPQSDYERLQRVISKVTLGSPFVAAGLSSAALAVLLSRIGPSALIGLARAGIPGAARLAAPPTPEELARSRRRMAVFGAGLGALPWMPFMVRSVKEKFAKMAGPMDYEGSMQTVQDDPFLPPVAKAQLARIFSQGLVRANPESRLRGLLTTTDVIKGAVGAGLGHTGAVVAGSLLGSLFGLPAGLRRELSHTGALAGALLGSGIISGG